MTELESFYIDRYKSKYKSDFLPEFSELTENEKRTLEKSLSFAGWVLGKELNNLKKVINRSLPAFLQLK